MTEPDPIAARLNRAAQSAVRMRRTNSHLIVAFTAITLINVFGWIAVGLALKGQIEDRHHRADREQLSDTRFEDIYRGLNNISAQLGRISPYPPGTIVLIPPTTAARSTPPTNPIRPGSASTAPAQRSTSTTTATTGPPATQPPTTSTSSTTTTTTTQPSCTTLPLTSRCVLPRKAP